MLQFLPPSVLRRGSNRRILSVSVELKDAERHWRQFLDCLVHRGIRGGASVSSQTTTRGLKPPAGQSKVESDERILLVFFESLPLLSATYSFTILGLFPFQLIRSSFRARVHATCRRDFSRSSNSLFEASSPASRTAFFGGITSSDNIATAT